jgi:hypothetical protein
VSWVRLADDFADHPKVRQLGKPAFCLHVWALCYCARHLTDGFIEPSGYRGNPWVSKRSAQDAALRELERTGLWTPVDGGYCIHDYLQYNPDRAEVLEKRRQVAERQARWRAKREQRRNASRNASTTERVDGPPTPTPKGVGVEEPATPFGGVPSLPRIEEPCERCGTRPSFNVRGHALCEEHVPQVMP